MDEIEIKQAFIELAKELENQCGDWQNMPDTEINIRIRKKIITALIEQFEDNNLD